jgi:hypothetical protein
MYGWMDRLIDVKPCTVAHAYYPGYSRSRYQEDHGSRPAQAKSFQNPISTNVWVQWYVPVILATWGSTNRVMSRLAWA